MSEDVTCPRCGSAAISSPATTDIPGDRHREHGCNDCLFVWGAEVDPARQNEIERR